jgi:molybdopterin synthase sulfur carrier subunit
VAEATVLVRYFAAAAEAAGLDEERVTVEATAGALRTWLTDRYGPAMTRILDAGSLLVDGTVTRDPARPLHAQVDVLPPFAGG